MRLLKPGKKRQRTTQRLTVSSSQGQRRKTSRKGAKSSAGKLPIFGRLASLTTLFAGRKSTRTSKRRHPKRLISFANLRRAVAAIAVFGVLGGGLWLWQDGWMARQTAAAVAGFYELSAKVGLKVNDLQVIGRNRTSSDLIIAALAIERDMPILQIDPQAAKANLESLTWVKAATVDRRFPNVVAVTLREREPMAIWQHKGVLSLVDQDGAVIDGVAVHRFAKLPLVVGLGAPQQTASLLDILESEPMLKARVAAAVWVAERRWNLKLDNGIDVNLPETNPAGAWAQLAKIEREHGVLERDVITIDLRLPDRLVVRTAPKSTPPKAKKGSGEST